MTSQKFVFTTNNYTELWELKDDMKYLTYGKEVGESGTLHLQGFVFYKKPVRITKVIKDFIGSHVEIAKTLSEAIEYCHKDGDIIELGERPKTQSQKGNKEKERWDLALKSAKKGDFESIPADIQVKYIKNLEYINLKYQGPPASLDWIDTPNQWIWGRAGVGKTRQATSNNPGAYIKSLDKWWDGYTGHHCVIVDDMDPFHRSLSTDLKYWGHHNPFRADLKGSSKYIRPGKVIVTSQYRIDEIWEDIQTREAMHRRFVEVYIASNECYEHVFKI